MNAACYRVQLAFVGRDAFDRRHLAPLALHDEGEAAVHALAVDQDRAGPAGALVAPLLGTGEPEPVAKEVEQRHPGLDLDRDRAAVDDKIDSAGHGSVITHFSSAWRSTDGTSSGCDH